MWLQQTKIFDKNRVREIVLIYECFVPNERCVRFFSSENCGEWLKEMQRLRSQWIKVCNPETSKKGALSTPWIVFVNSIVCFNSVHYFYWLHTFCNCALLLLLHAKPEPNNQWAGKKRNIFFFHSLLTGVIRVSKCAIEFVIFETFDHLNGNLAQYSIQN